VRKRKIYKIQKVDKQGNIGRIPLMLFVFEFNHSEHFARHVVIWNTAVKYLHVSVLSEYMRLFTGIQNIGLST